MWWEERSVRETVAGEWWKDPWTVSEGDRSDIKKKQMNKRKNKWVQFSRSVVSDSLWRHGLQHARLSCPSPTPGVYSNSRPSSRWCHPTISSSCHPLLLLPSIFPSIRVFSSESVHFIRWPKYWSFSFSNSPSNEYSGLISFRMDWLDRLAVQGTLKSLIQHHSSKASILQSSLWFKSHIHTWLMEKP